MNDKTSINQAISKHLSLWWTAESREKIKAEFGESVLQLIEEICRFADQETERMIKSGEDSRAYRVTTDRLSERYGFLTGESITRVANMAAYSWK